MNPISGNHDVYLKFVGSGSGELFRLQSFQFITNSKPTATNSRPENNLPRRFYLEQNYPNPFNPVTRIKYSVPKTSYLTIKVYDVMGREVATVFDGVQQAGNYTAILDGSNLTSGIYFYKMETNGFVETKKLVLLK
ncbi:MAG: T9SS type A sorting domain-containing protein [Candidatus Marinimicrobia bacterium]|nr:T9SS type A sorting domain-containing protein [Candidatus Neomarinimicrobiota bacterium]